MKKKIIILGTGGNCVDILDTINEINASLNINKYDCIGFLDDDPSKTGTKIHGVPVLGPLKSSVEYRDTFFVNGIGSSNNFWKKEGIIKKTNIPIERFENIIHPSASVSSFSRIDKGTVILQNVTIASNVKIGNHVIILPNSVISHDDIIGDYSCIAGGVCISGGVTIGKHTYIGTNSTVIENIEIGDKCLVGMGSNVLRGVPTNSVVVGNPAKFLRKTV